MALDDILQKISNEANKKAAFMKQIADDEIKKIEDEANEKATDKKKEIDELAEEKAKSIIQKAEVLAKMESRSALLTEKRAVVDDVFSSLLDDLTKLSDSEYTDLVSNMLRSASKELSQGQLIIPKGKRPQTEAAIKQSGVSYEISEECSCINSGFIISDEKAELNMSFDYLINRIVRPQTELEVAKTLFN